MVLTTTDAMEYGPIPANVRHAVDLVTQVHGYAKPVEMIAAVVGWNARFQPQTAGPQFARAAALLAEAAEILERLEVESEAQV